MAGRYLSALEEHLSARLIERSTRRLSLTDAGRAYFDRSKRILEDLEEADGEAADRQANPRGTLATSPPPSLWPYVFGSGRCALHGGISRG